jgi:probable HAF family extracellular repeat protein
LHAFRTGSNNRINARTDDLGVGVATSINDYGQVIGQAPVGGDPNNHPFLYSGRRMLDLNSLIPPGSNCVLAESSSGTEQISFGTLSIDIGPDINNAGQISTNGICDGQMHAVRLDPIYKAFVQAPINADGSSVFNAKRGVIPVKFTLTQSGVATCNLRPATIAVTRASGGTLTQITESNPHFRTDGCRYHYNLAASTLGVGTYRLDISINGIMVGHAVFALR